MHTLVIMFKEGMPIFPYSIRYDGELIHYMTYNNSQELSLRLEYIADIRFISISELNLAIRRI
jgi:hypothetical protein